MQSGGNFEVDYTVMDPDDKVLMEGVNERQGDFIFTANKVCSHALVMARVSVTVHQAYPCGWIPLGIIG